MQPLVKELLERLMTDPEFADHFFSGPEQVLAEMDLDVSDREALLRLDRGAVMYMAGVEEHEPKRAQEHAGNNAQNRWMTLVIGLWGCAAYVLFWLLLGGALS